ncbi:hypothetical protein [Actinosynnema sp. NPDC020468]|uniref:hypothetical protein n=1 Tax=Actinosynnema sp. NPDC020468 TaxID=3154488 RepID=UPI0033FC873C
MAAVLVAAGLLVGACTGGGSAAGGSSASAGPTSTSAASGSGSTTGSASVPTSDPVVWAGTYCEGAGPAVVGALEMLKALLAGGAGDPAAQKQAFLTYVDKVSGPMVEAGTKLEKLGPPSAEAVSLHADVVKALKETGAEAGEVRTKLAALDPTSPDFESQLSALGDGQTYTTEVKDQITRLKADPKLTQAFQTAPQCLSLVKALESAGI